ncbi:class I SAM-dependent methyltransferase [Paenibacillus pini]|uniref:Methyltransferase domain-containing protein n=1 Tax=Paenibacillus pini JCM 16418 TaxID=1236976 RepID=W7YJA6_9BACL|nr:class I SAM-dependent methyltransferase [Paenibacillus pini]GAF07693.1 hypothetical protein JCM16418_1721 [Paenibacillus pini JCM 16418]
MDGRNEVSSKFDEVAYAYDAQRRKLIPCFNDFYQTSVSLADTSVKRPNILDLGAGTGLFSSLLLEKYPEAEITLIDLSSKMLEVAESRLARYSNVNYVLDDYTNYIALDKYDLIVSALSIHHLSDSDKMKLYKNTLLNLKANGVFINADQVLGHTEAIDMMYRGDWKSKVEASSLSREEKDSAYERTKIDRMTPLQTQLNWLQDVGFDDVDCVYKYYNFVVMYGKKREDSH